MNAPFTPERIAEIREMRLSIQRFDKPFIPYENADDLRDEMLHEIKRLTTENEKIAPFKRTRVRVQMRVYVDVWMSDGEELEQVARSALGDGEANFVEVQSWHDAFEENTSMNPIVHPNAPDATQPPS